LKPSNIVLLAFLAAAVVATAAWLMEQRSGEAETHQMSPLGRAETTGGSTATASMIAPVVSLLSWVGVAATLAYKGAVRHLWARNMFDYSVFRLMVRMRGAPTRVKMLKSLEAPMNRHQLAKSLGLDWKTVDRNIELLRSHGLIHEIESLGGGRLYVLSPQGQHLLDLLEKLSET